jgi:hypothetical protein
METSAKTAFRKGLLVEATTNSIAGASTEHLRLKWPNF